MGICTDPVLITPRTILKEQIPFGKRLIVSCGKCHGCLYQRRSEIAGQAIMEALWTHEVFGSSHVWMVSLTYAPDQVPRARTSAHELGLEENGYRPGPEDDHMDPLSMALAHRQELRRQGHSDQEISEWELGTYEGCMTLRVKDVQDYLKRCRQAVGPFRVFYAGEYGEKEGHTRRPHYHVMFYGINRAQMIECCNQWRRRIGGNEWTVIGRTDPDPTTLEGLRKIEKYERMNSNPAAAGAYVTKYALKPMPAPKSLAELDRVNQFNHRSNRPGLGYHWAAKYLVPKINLTFRSELRDPLLAELPEHIATITAAKNAIRATTYVVQIAGQSYPLGRYLRDRLLESSDLAAWPLRSGGQATNLLPMARYLLLEEKAQEAQFALDDPEGRVQWKEALDERRRRAEAALERRAKREAEKKALAGRRRRRPRAGKVRRGAA